MVLDPENVRIVVILKAGSAKHEVRSPDPIPRPEAEQMIAAIRKAREEQAEVDIAWLAVRGDDVAAAYIEIDPNDNQRTVEELLAELEKMGIVTTTGGATGPGD